MRRAKWVKWAKQAQWLAARREKRLEPARTEAGAAGQALSVSIVLYRPDIALLRRTLATLAEAASRAGLAGGELFLIDNSPAATPDLADAARAALRGTFMPRLLQGHGNVGYGRGHNLALPTLAGPFHLVLNPDVELAPDALCEAVAFLRRHPDCVLLSPAAAWPDGRAQPLCKRYPTIAVLLLRGFMPAWVRRRFAGMLDRYEMRDAGAGVVWDPPVVSGCFMLFRTPVLQRLGGFDPRYFLYFEDFDLSLRAARHGRLACAPGVRIVHHGGGAAAKGWRHVALFVRSAARFFSSHGWRLW